MRAAHPYAQVWHHRPFWYGAHPVGRWTWTTGSRNDLRDVLDALDKLIALDHTLTATEDARPGWQVYLSPLRTWHACRSELKLDATNASDLDAQIAEVERIEGTWRGWTLRRRGDEWSADHPDGLFDARSVDGPDLQHVEERIAEAEQAWRRQRRQLRRPKGN